MYFSLYPSREKNIWIGVIWEGGPRVPAHGGWRIWITLMNGSAYLLRGGPGCEILLRENFKPVISQQKNPAADAVTGDDPSSSVWATSTAGHLLIAFNCSWKNIPFIWYIQLFYYPAPCPTFLKKGVILYCLIPNKLTVKETFVCMYERDNQVWMR